jgi:UDP-glucose 4-epimerase
MTNNRSDQPCSLVTGGAGFIGSHVAAHCLKMGRRVIVLDDLSGGFADQVPAGAELVIGSVTDHEMVAKLFAQHKFDYVYHLAAYAAEGLSHFIRRFNYTVNLTGTVNLINEAVKSGTRCFVFTSSIAVYGKGQLPMREDMAPRPEDPYGVSKYAAELDLAAAHEMFGLPFIVFRPHNVYGEHQNLGDPYRNVLGIFMNQIMSGKPLTIFGDGEQTRAFSHIDDVAPHIARSVQAPAAYNQIFNIGADEPYTVNELAGVIAREFSAEAQIRNLPARNEVYSAYASHEKAREVLGASASVSLADGVRRMARWARLAGSRKGKPFGGIEIGLRLPPSWAAMIDSAPEVKAPLPMPATV